MAASPNIETDFLNLARLALAGRQQDIQQLLYRIARAQRDALPQLAGALNELLRKAPSKESPLRRHSEVALPVDVDTRFQLLRVEEHPVLDHELIATPGLQDGLKRLVDERTHLGALIDAGLQPTRSAIFIGPPGVGKTMAARYVARELGRPLLILDLAAVMSSYLGRTGTNLRHVLDYAKSFDSVLLLDEIDAIAKRRDDQAEIGELKRLVTVLIQQIDDWPSSSLLLAATNHSNLLDPAIWRRFDEVIEFPLPSADAIAAMVKAMLPKDLERDWVTVLSLAMQGKSFSEVERGLVQVKRAMVIGGTNLEDELAKLVRNPTVPRSRRIAVAKHLVDGNLTSQRTARKLTGVARDTMRAHAGEGSVEVKKPETAPRAPKKAVPAKRRANRGGKDG